MRVPVERGHLESDISHCGERQRIGRCARRQGASAERGLSPQDQAQLPWGLDVDLVMTPAGIALWALQLREGSGPSGPTFGRVCKLFADAAMRLAKLHPHAAGPVRDD